MYLKLNSVFAYLQATPTSRSFVEGEAVLQAGHVIQCGFTEKNKEIWHVNARCVQTSAVKKDPHEIRGILICAGDVHIKEMACSCKAGASGFCKHIAATLLFISRLCKCVFLYGAIIPRRLLLLLK